MKEFQEINLGGRHDILLLPRTKRLYLPFAGDKRTHNWKMMVMMMMLMMMKLMMMIMIIIIIIIITIIIMECKKSYTSNNRGDWIHFKITHTVPEQRNRKARNEGITMNCHIGHCTRITKKC